MGLLERFSKPNHTTLCCIWRIDRVGHSVFKRTHTYSVMVGTWIHVIFYFTVRRQLQVYTCASILCAMGYPASHRWLACSFFGFPLCWLPQNELLIVLKFLKHKMTVAFLKEKELHAYFVREMVTYYHVNASNRNQRHRIWYAPGNVFNMLRV